MSDTLIAGRFRLRGLLGSGGTAAVFAADDTLTGARVALKLLHPHLAEDPARWDAFFEEVHAARAIEHPNIAGVVDAGAVDDGTPVVWIAMELAVGTTLDEVVRERGPLDTARVRIVGDRVLAALAAAHAEGVVHRDVTPANIVIDPDTVDDEAFAAAVRLLDFGLADVPGRATVGGDALLSGAAGAETGVVASVAYASPEQLRGEPVTEASDLYQTGAVLFFALTGRAPFGGDAAAVARAHVSAPPPLPSARRRGIPRAFDRVVATALLKDPADRFADAAAMQGALAAVDAPTPDAAAEPASHTGPTRMYRTVLPGSAVDGAATAPVPYVAPDSAAPRSRWAAWAAAGAGAAVIVGVVALSAAAGSAPSAAPSHTPPPTVIASEPTTTSEPTVAPASVAVPAVAGLALGEATQALQAVGLRVGDVTRIDGATAADIVLELDPGAGAWREVGSAVALRVASGSNTVPGVAGLTLAAAAEALAAAGFNPLVEYSGTGPTGVALSARPAVGTALPVGSIVSIIAASPEVVPEPTPTPTPAHTVPPTPTPAPSTP
ncbi:PASTA domain-containing protein [Microbacterium sp. CIAB417]|uniref:protein kinase domain-containing protein n=1 Tax=Microbacterium sp. CIAB417 TaxID=2860287 RepID=UPI001FACFFD3|nr:PASTA domain-containing protein [Microbacterium sp. CIAB417]